MGDGTIEQAVQVFAVIHLAITGLSHFVQPRAWAEFFIYLREKRETGVFVVAFLSLGFGSIIVAFHNVWTGLPMVLTVLGWLQIFKALVYLVFPSVGLQKLSRVSIEKAYLFKIPGVGFMLIAGLLIFHLIGG